MKRIAMTLLVVAAFTASASAQEKRHIKGHQHHKHQHHMMAKQLNFSADQQKQAKLYHEESRKKMQELNKNENITVKEFRDRKAAIHKEQQSKMQALMTPEQKAKMQQLKADRQKHKEEHFARHMDKMKSQLSLSDAQVDQMKSQREATQLKVRGIRDNQSLSREEKRSQLMALKEQAKDQRKKILSPDQLKKMEEMKQKHMDKDNEPVK